MCAEFSACVALRWCLYTYSEVHPYEASCRDYSCNQMWKRGFFTSPSRCNCHSFYDTHYASQGVRTSRLKPKPYKKAYKSPTLSPGCKQNLISSILVEFHQAVQKHCSKPAQTNICGSTPGLRCFIKSTEFWSACMLLKTAWNIQGKTLKNVWPNYLSSSMYFKWRS